jgi:hypothetical protein
MFQNLTQDPVSARKVEGAHLNNSEMGFAQIEDTLTKLLTTHTLTPLTLCLTGPRGSGKSFFLNNLQTKLESQATIIAINLWEWDYISEPLHLLFQLLVLEMQSKKQKIAKTLLSAASTVIQTLYHTATYHADAGLSSAFQAVLTTKGGKAKPDNQLLFQQLQSHKKELRDALTEATEKKPIVIILDELDRCKPDFALLTLERIKHYLNIPNLKVVLGCNIPQLHISIKHVYGTDTAAEEYLRRLIDYQFTLPEPELSGIVTRCLNSSQIKGFDQSKILAILELFKKLPHAPNLRDHEQILGHFIFLHQTGLTPPSNWDYGYFPLLFLCYAKVQSNDNIFNMVKQISQEKHNTTSPFTIKFNHLFSNTHQNRENYYSVLGLNNTTSLFLSLDFEFLNNFWKMFDPNALLFKEARPPNSEETEFKLQFNTIDERRRSEPNSRQNLTGYLPACVNALAYLTLPQAKEEPSG